MGGVVDFELGLSSGDEAFFVAAGGVVAEFPTGTVVVDVCRRQPMNAMVMSNAQRIANLTPPNSWRIGSEGWSRRIMGSFSV